MKLKIPMGLLLPSENTGYAYGLWVRTRAVRNELFTSRVEYFVMHLLEYWYRKKGGAKHTHTRFVIRVCSTRTVWNKSNEFQKCSKVPFSRCCNWQNSQPRWKFKNKSAHKLAYFYIFEFGSSSYSNMSISRVLGAALLWLSGYGLWI